jgi:hypothetical protein
LRDSGEADVDGDSHPHENRFGSNNDIDTGDNISAFRVVSNHGKQDRCDAAHATPSGAVSVKDWGVYDGPYSIPEDRDTRNYDTATKELQVLN